MKLVASLIDRRLAIMYSNINNVGVWCLACVHLLLLFVPYDITVLVVHHQIFLYIPGRDQLLCRQTHIVKIITEAW